MISHAVNLIKRRIKRRLLVALFRRPKMVHASTRKEAQPYLDNYGWPTTRCFPRTTADAFKDGEYTEWFFPPERDWRHIAMLVVGVLAWTGLGFYFGRSWL